MVPYEQDDKFGILRHFIFFIKIDFVRGLEGSLGAILSQNGIAQFWDSTVKILGVLLKNNSIFTC